VSEMTTPTVATASELAGVTWRTSTRSGNGSGNCVEVGPVLDGTGRVAVRHSRNPHGQVIVYTRAEWEAFIAGAKDGEFDFD
jgi:Domain of unknown function (DUF397).